MNSKSVAKPAHETREIFVLLRCIPHFFWKVRELVGEIKYAFEE